MQATMEKLWESRHLIKEDKAFKAEAQKSVQAIIEQLDSGRLRIADKTSGTWVVNEWAKKSILMNFMLNDKVYVETSSMVNYFDKVALKFAGWSAKDFNAAGFRLVPGAIVRQSAFIEKNCVIMPSFINVGSAIGEGTLIDTWANIGSCAQIGKNCHISMNVGIGGVLEPLQANPVIIEDNVFIGAGSQIVEGVIVEEGAVIGMGVFIGAFTRIYDRETQEVIYGRVPAYSVVVSGMLPGSDGKTMLDAAIIVKKVDAATRSKTSINDLLRG